MKDSKIPKTRTVKTSSALLGHVRKGRKIPKTILKAEPQASNRSNTTGFSTPAKIQTSGQLLAALEAAISARFMGLHDQNAFSCLDDESLTSMREAVQRSVLNVEDIQDIYDIPE